MQTALEPRERFCGRTAAAGETAQAKYIRGMAKHFHFAAVRHLEGVSFEKDIIINTMARRIEQAHIA